MAEMKPTPPSLRERCDIALACLPQAEYRERLAALFDDLLAPKVAQSQSEWLDELMGRIDDHAHWRWETGVAEQAGRTKAALVANDKALAARAALLAHASARPASPQAQPPALSDERSMLKAIFAHWNEFGPEHGFGELMDRSESALLAEAQKPTPDTAGVNACPACKGAGPLCPICGTAGVDAPRQHDPAPYMKRVKKPVSGVEVVREGYAEKLLDAVRKATRLPPQDTSNDPPIDGVQPSDGGQR